MIVENNDLLMTKKCEVVTSKDSVGVAEIASKEKPDLILMDIHFNGSISVITLIKALKKNTITKYIPIIAITAFAIKNDKVEISKSGCEIYLLYFSKPISIDSFFKAIDNFINSKPLVQR